ncbi:sulfite exporter TauE/SafE [Nitrosospira sp. Nsp5]|uniref:Sulfite exporter TauE/SafE n=1 Tax=Nitrosospira multiformis TaxID=1231 RepID=A0ABY0TH80_9PROT|nr:MULTISPECIES: sulfite exporter TauE/SafE family protein [Nitrosospira]PTR05542.1 sulfite exporter TauE/SafE [Nitrosospira sp. Nsp5]SDQ83058.1 Sulfite exporter TauE/SafE [Nitrosospira multiformis]
MAAKSAHLKVKGMHCTGCEETIENAVGHLPGIRKVNADYVKQTVDIEFDSKSIGESGIRHAIEEKGYEFESAFTESSGHAIRNALIFLTFLLVVGGMTFWGKSMIPGLVGEMSPQLGYAMLFSIGFFTGFHCIGMCGGFVVGYAAAIEPRTASTTAMAHLMYATGKTASYTAIGGSLGLLGSLMAFTPVMRGAVTLAASLFVIIYGLKMLNVFPVLRNFTLRLPRFVVRGVSNELRQRRSPLSIGLLNGLMLGCGPLQAMYIMAAGTGSAQEGAMMLFFFGLGTLVPLLSFGLIASSVSRDIINLLVRASAIMVIAMGLMMADRGLKLTGSGYDFNSLSARWQQATPAGNHLESGGTTRQR